MAGSDSQKQLLSLIRDFSTEKSQGGKRQTTRVALLILYFIYREWMVSQSTRFFILIFLVSSANSSRFFFFLKTVERRVLNQRKQIEELAFELDALNKDLEEAKRNKDTTQQELKGYEVELSMNKASTQALEVRFSVSSWFFFLA